MLQHKPFDDEAIMFDSITLAAGSTGAVGNHDSTAVDLGGEDIDKVGLREVIFKIGSDFTASTGATVTVSLLDCDTVGGSYAVLTPVQVTTAAIAKASLTGVITILPLPIPRDGVRRFLKVRYAVGVDTLTAGTITAGVVPVG